MASALICLSSGQRFNFSKYIFESLVRNVDSTSKFYMYPRFIQLIIQSNITDLSKRTNTYISPVLTQKVFANMIRVGKGFSRVETPLFENMLTVRTVDAEEEVQVPAQDDVQKHVIEEIATEVLDKCSALVLRVEGLETANAAQQLEIIKLKARVKKLERLNKVKSSKLRCLKKVGTSQRLESSKDEENVFNQERISVDIDQDEGVELVVDQEKDAEVEGRQADTQAEIYNIDLDHSSKVLSMQEDTEVQEAVEVVTTAKLITKVVTAAATQVTAASAPIPAAKPKVLKIADAPAVSTRKRKGVVIRDPEEKLHDDTPAETPSVKDKGKEILIEDPKPIKKKDQIEMDAEYAKKLQEELEKEHEEAYKQIDWNAAFDHVQAKETQYIKRYHGFKKKPQSLQTPDSGISNLLAVGTTFTGSGFFIIAVQTPDSGISILLAVGTPSTGSGNLYCQWELSPGTFLNGELKEEVYVSQLEGFVDQDNPSHVCAIDLMLFTQKTGNDLLMAKPTEKHLNAVKRIFRYLKGTINIGLWYSKDTGMSLTVYADADHTGCEDTRRSTSGCAQFFGDKLVSWSSNKQKSIMISSTKAEYIALSGCCAQIL
nr:uncharacterized mitochondrial protein AtMg00810-like [Tanacetum cinerariifolium]